MPFYRQAVLLPHPGNLVLVPVGPAGAALDAPADPVHRPIRPRAWRVIWPMAAGLPAIMGPGKLSVSRSETDPLALRAMSGAVEIPQLAKTRGDAREATKDPLDCPGAVRARLSRRRMQPERLLRLFDQDG